MSRGIQHDTSTDVVSIFKWNEIILGLRICVFIHMVSIDFFVCWFVLICVSCACVNYNRTLPILRPVVQDTCFNVLNGVDAYYSINLVINFYLQR